MNTAEQLAHLAAIIDSTDDAIISKNLDGTITSWNRGAERLFGYSSDEIVGHSVLALIPEEMHAEEEMIFARIRKGEKVDHFETVRRAKDGRALHVSVTISPIRNEKGEIIGASKVARSIDDKVSTAALQARLAAIVESSDDAIVSKDLNGIVQSWNGGAERLFGFMAEEMIGQPITKILPPDRFDEETRILARLRKGERVDHFETVRRRKDGRLVDISVSISPIHDGTGKIIGASKVARDISERKVLEATMSRLKEELEERVQERTAALEAANREMEAFTYSVAHDLRGPLREIALTSAMLCEDFSSVLPQDAQQLLSQQVDSTKRLARLIEDLLRYARLGQTGVNPAPIDISKMAQDVSNEVVLSYPDAQILIQDDMTAVADYNLVRLLFQNLIENACKFSPGQAHVRVGQRESVFFVEDKGSGFDMTYAEKIFRPFERLVRIDQAPGTGIGLAHVQRIIEKHSGSIWVQSKVGEGTTFYFTLPDPTTINNGSARLM